MFRQSDFKDYDLDLYTIQADNEVINGFELKNIFYCHINFLPPKF